MFLKIFKMLQNLPHILDKRCSKNGLRLNKLNIKNYFYKLSWQSTQAVAVIASSPHPMKRKKTDEKIWYKHWGLYDYKHFVLGVIQNV